MNDDGEAHKVYIQVGRSLAGCQLVEQELKLYIGEAFELVRKLVSKKLTFKMSGDQYSDIALLGLIRAFGKLCDNDSLVSRLKDFKNKRNELVHESMALCIDPDGAFSRPEADDLRERASKIAARADELVRDIHDEANKFRSHLYFDDLEDQG